MLSRSTDRYMLKRQTPCLGSGQNKPEVVILNIGARLDDLNE